MFVLLRLLAEWRLCKGRGIARLRPTRKRRLVVRAPLLVEVRLLAGLALPFAEALVMMLAHLVVMRLVARARLAALRLVDARAGGRFAAWTVRQPLDADVV